MNKYNKQNYIDAIQSVYPESWFIRQPEITGSVGTVYLAETPEGTIVCKFNNKKQITRNQSISQLLRTHNLPLPQTQEHIFSDLFFESYKYDPGKTLYERMQNDMTPAQIFDAYKQSMVIQSKISCIDPRTADTNWKEYAYETFAHRKTIENIHVNFAIFDKIYKFLSTHSNLKLLHNDIQPKNIILDDDLKLSSIIDLDTVALCNENFSVLRALRNYPLNNYSEYMDCYEDTVKRKLNRNAIMQGLNMVQQLRNIRHTVQKKR